MSTQGGSEAKSGMEELYERIAKLIQPIEARLSILEKGPKDQIDEGDEQFRTPNSQNFEEEIHERRESFGRRASFAVVPNKSPLISDETSTISGALSATRLKQPEKSVRLQR